MNTDSLMQILTVPAFFNSRHHDVFRRHKWQFGKQPFFDHFWINHQTADNIDVKFQYSIYCQKTFCHAETFVGGIIQRPFKPLRCCGHAGIHRVADHKS
ncbi:hypothetical protein SDC9_117541 [bioreactor metagenome]|uniref:Uncharacterized protein n=1 Tax=bioreactor metagenome TaxID=1076179 RepID=A0A645BYH9_9ZZZZ